MAYTPREIKDRVAVGDDIFIVEDLGNNRIRLIPAPTYVSEPGTPINKEFLQPIEDYLATGVVPVERTITAGNGLSGGGSLDADRTISLGTPSTISPDTTNNVTSSSHTHAVSGLVPSARQIKAGTGLTGGGNLSADRTLSVKFGTTEGTVCEGNDYRLSNARPPTAHNHDDRYYTKSQLDTHIDATSSVHGATSSATAHRIIIRDSAGRAKVAAPSASDDIARKAEVDTVSSALNTHKSSADHDGRYYTKSQLNTSGGGGQVHWNNVTSKPSTFPPSSHTHAWGDITGNSGVITWKTPGNTILLEWLSERSIQGTIQEGKTLTVARFTVGTPGYYRITGELRSSDRSNTGRIRVYVKDRFSDNEILLGSFSTSSTSYTSFTIDLSGPLYHGDPVRVEIYAEPKGSSEPSQITYCRNIRLRAVDGSVPSPTVL